MRSDSAHHVCTPTIAHMIPIEDQLLTSASTQYTFLVFVLPRQPNFNKYAIHFPPVRAALLYSSKPESR
jgi:hypothetical protein